MTKISSRVEKQNTRTIRSAAFASLIIAAAAQCRISDQLKYDAWNYIPVVGRYLMAIQFTVAP